MNGIGKYPIPRKDNTAKHAREKGTPPERTRKNLNQLVNDMNEFSLGVACY